MDKAAVVLIRGTLAITLACSACLSTPARPAGQDGSMRSDARRADASGDAPIGLLVGDPRHEQCVDEHSDGQAEASSFVAVATGNVTSLSIDYGGGTTAMLVLSLYDDDSASFAPRSLLATAVVSSGSALGMGVYSGSTDLHPQIAQGTRY